MRKRLIVVAAAVTISVSGFAFAQMEGPANGMKQHCMGCGMTGKGCMGTEMHAPMRAVVATSDGGVVIASPKKVVKYDKNMHLVKEVQLPDDMAGMNTMMAGMPKCHKMDEGMTAADMDNSSGGPDVAPSKGSHSGHH